MSDLISRAKLFNKLANIKAPPEANEYKAEVYSLIQSIETADEVVPEGLVVCSPSTAEHVAIVVRCKDCKYLYSENGCPLRTWHTHVEDDFCSYGERRE